VKVRQWWVVNPFNSRTHGPFWMRQTAQELSSRLNEDEMFDGGRGGWHAIHFATLRHSRRARPSGARHIAPS
jgi:hypothetical protein